MMIDGHTVVKAARVQHAVSLRSGMSKFVDDGLSSVKSGAYHRWSRMIKCDIVEVVITVPRNDAILQQWNIIDNSEVSSIDTSLFPSDPNITLYVAFPISILPHSIPAPTEKNKFGCLMLDCHDILSKLPKHVPVSVFFHGGGLTIGTPRMTEYIDLLLLNTTATTGGKENQTAMKPFIYISVDYSLAPEYSFPVQPIEACSVISHLLDLDYKLHLSGFSAGAYLALVASLEVYRVQHRNRSNIRSVIAACPMLSPATDTVSFYQNQSSSHTCPVHFLQWSYRSFLNLPEPKEESSQSTDPVRDNPDLLALLGRNTTRSDYYRTPWYQSPNSRRLIEPGIDVPVTLATDKKVPNYIVTTNKADPLYDGGIQMVKALTAVNESIVVHHDDFGSHWLGTLVDSVAHRKLSAAAQEAILQVEEF